MDLGPIEILYNWQSVLLAVGVSAAVQGVKRALDIALGGKDKRKAVRLVTQVLLPLLPLLLGSLGAILVPLHPEKLTEYVTSHANVKPWVAFGAWGAAVGQFSDYLYQRARSVMAALAKPSDRVSAPSSEPVDPPSTEEPKS
jgi:hypothetical protein